MKRKPHIMVLERKEPQSFKDGAWVIKTETFDVEVLAIVGKQAMVRRKGCYPFVVEVKNLTGKVVIT